MADGGNVLVTGTSTGIGRATALHLDQLGFRVFASVRKESDADALRAEASERLTPILLDVTEPDAICRAQQEVYEAVGESGLSGVVNNAGIVFLSPLECAPVDDVRRLFEVNAFGMLAVTQAFLPLVRQAHGRIVNVSSAASLFVIPFHGPYSASKLAVDGFSDALRRELKPLGVKVSVISLGSIDTPIWDKGPDWSAQIVSRQPQEIMEGYNQGYRKIWKMFKQSGQSGIAPDVAARAVAHALTAKQPKRYYLVGKEAYMLSFIRMMPRVLQDWLVQRITS